MFCSQMAQTLHNMSSMSPSLVFCKFCATLGHNTSACSKGSSKRKQRSQDTQPDMGSPSAAKQVVEKQQPYGLNPLVDTPAVPMTTEINTSSLRRHPSTGRKRTKLVMPANLASSPILCPDPYQTKQVLLVLWQCLNRSMSPMVT
ncbi:hypothetical protein NC651_002034 [Populus alba x Populus x berolinensis]|nr:hypothetical protein NC651_002034 [Populus alba x Populus x berolinensis]